MTYLAALVALVFAAIHLFIDRLRFLDVIPRSRWLSAAGGVAVAYVFLHILPELASHQETFADAMGLAPAAAEAWVYLVGLAGLATFYGLERAAKQSRARTGADSVEAHVFWIHLGSFGLYNLLIGYLLLHREDPGVWSLATYTVAIGLHFLTTDFGLRNDHTRHYDRHGRFILAAAVLAGWMLGTWADLPEIVIGLAFAFLAGGILLNVLKEELTEERKSRFLPFALGLAGYAAILLAG